jgi:hypothetical protein
MAKAAPAEAGDPTARLLLEIKGDLGETFGLVSAVRQSLEEHRREDREDLHEVKERVGRIEQSQAEGLGATRARENSEVRRAGVVAAAIAGVISILGQLVPHWLK